jgi:endonuclease/exonuclease/phosphatase family metal-dependent hydrolase
MGGVTTTLRVLSYNVRGLRDDVAALTRVITGSGADLVCVQEAPKVFRWRARCAALARRCGMVVVAGGGGAAGNLLMSTLAIRVHAARSVLLPLTPGQQLRGAAVAHCSLRGAEFTAVSTHLSLDPPERARQVPLLLAEVPEELPPLVLAADFNEQPGGPVWEAFAPRLDDVAAIAGDPGTPTFSCASPRRRIDGFFVERAVKVAGYRVLDSPDVRRASDHFPVYAELALPG